VRMDTGMSQKEYSGAAQLRQGVAYGGQAVIEGVMMRGRYKVAVAVRNPRGEIVVYEDSLNPAIYRSVWTELPFVRGTVMLWDAMSIGVRALLWSAEIAAGIEKPTVDASASLGVAAFSMSMSAGMVFLAPAIASSGLGRFLNLKNNTVVTVVEGLVRLGLVVSYIYAVGQTKEGSRLFAYHGAEHKTVNALEAGAPLTPESVRQFPLEHPRCGTAFLLTVMLLSTLVQVLIGRPRFSVLLLTRILLLPVIAGVAYEFIRFASQNMQDPLVRAIIAPNLMLQRLTTREPDLDQIRVAITAMERVLAAEDEAAQNSSVSGGTNSNPEIIIPHVTVPSGNGHAK